MRIMRRIRWPYHQPDRTQAATATAPVRGPASPEPLCLLDLAAAPSDAATVEGFTSRRSTASALAHPGRDHPAPLAPRTRSDAGDSANGMGRAAAKG